MVAEATQMAHVYFTCINRFYAYFIKKGERNQPPRLQ